LADELDDAVELDDEVVDEDGVGVDADEEELDDCCRDA